MKLGALHKIRNNLNQGTALSLYKSLVLPHFDYCDTVYTCSALVNLNKLQLSQNAACRTILLADFDEHIHVLHKRLGLLYLDDRRDLHLTCLCHKSVYFNDLSSLSNFFVPVVPVVGRYTRACDMVKLRIPHMCTKKAFRFRGPKMWNSLPRDPRLTSNFTTFRRLVSMNITALFENHPT